MEKPTGIELRENKVRPSYRRHQQQKFWQILLPVILGVLLVLVVIALVILTATGGDPVGQVSIWADASMIWLILPVMLFTVICVVILGGLIYLLARLLKILPTYTTLVQNYVALAAAWVKYIVNKIVSPFITVNSYGSAAERFLRKFFTIFHQK